MTNRRSDLTGKSDCFAKDVVINQGLVERMVWTGEEWDKGQVHFRPKAWHIQSPGDGKILGLSWGYK